MRVQTGLKTPHATAADGHRILMLTKAMDLSAKRGEAVRLPVDPEEDSNNGEVFAEALPDTTHIPLYFNDQTDRCGGVAAPSFDVAGLSRTHGPVGDTGPLRGGDFEAGTYPPDGPPHVFCLQFDRKYDCGTLSWRQRR